jgi:hypothetical protein
MVVEGRRESNGGALSYRRSRCPVAGRATDLRKLHPGSVRTIQAVRRQSLEHAAFRRETHRPMLA